MKLSIVVPLYNEQEHILEMLEKLLSVKMPDFLESTEIIIVDDCSKDKSFDLVSNYITIHPQIKLLQHQVNQGKGAAVRTGFSIATGDVFLVQDADLELNPEDIPRLLEVMHNLGVELVNGSRYMAGMYRPLSSFKRYMGNRLFTLITSLIIDIKITDMACGYKLIRRSLYEKLTLKENRFGFEAELMIKAAREKRNNVVEVPVQYFPRSEDEGKKLRNIDAIKMLGTIFRYGFPKVRLSKVISVLILLVAIFTVFNQGRWNSKKNGVIVWDVISYYSYLPATFIYHDLSLDYVEKKGYDQSKNPVWYDTTPTGKKGIRTSMGLSILYMPFFLVAHTVSLIAGKDIGGYSSLYQCFLVLSSLFYFALGLFALRKILLHYFKETIATFVLILIVFGTNLFNYVVFDSAMSHGYSFALICCFIRLTIDWYERITLKKTISLGVLLGLIALVRPTNALVVVFFLLYGIQSWADAISRFKLIVQKFPLLLLMAVCCVAVWIPQMLYWKYISGSYVYFSYRDNQTFFFSNPQIMNNLFSYRKGWLLYTPVMGFALIGIFFLLKYAKRFFLPLFIFTLLNIYIISSWWDWWYGGGYGLRAYIDSYGLMAIPLAYFTQWAYERKRVLTTILIFVFTLHSIFQTMQYHYNAIHPVFMTKAAYWDSFGRIFPSEKYKSLLEEPDYEAAHKGIYIVKKKVN